MTLQLHTEVIAAGGAQAYLSGDFVGSVQVRNESLVTVYVGGLDITDPEARISLYSGFAIPAGATVTVPVPDDPDTRIGFSVPFIAGRVSHHPLRAMGLVTV